MGVGVGVGVRVGMGVCALILTFTSTTSQPTCHPNHHPSYHPTSPPQITDSGLVATGALTLASDALRAIAKGIPTSLTHHASQHAIAHIKECAKDAGVDVKRAVMGGGPGSEGGAVGAFDFVFQVTCEAEGR